MGPLQGFRSKLGRLFNANVKLSDEFEMKFDFGADSDEDTGGGIDFSGQEPLGKCPRCGSRVFDHGISYACEKAIGSVRTCDFKNRKIILARPLTEQTAKLLSTGKTDLLQKFISKKGRPFSAYLVIGQDGKVGFEFEPRDSKTKPVSTAAENKSVKPKAKSVSPKKIASGKAK